MQIGVLGLNHKSAPLELREKLAKGCRKRFGAACSFHGDLCYILLSTCNRSEIYFSSDDLAGTHSYLLGILRQEIDDEFEHTIYSYFGADCFFHLAKVTCGMDSAILGETEIQGQVKLAYEWAGAHHPLSSELHYLFQKALKIGKEIRTRPLMPTLEEIVFHLAAKHLEEFTHKTILFVGLSTISQKILKLLILNNLGKITLCNRTYMKGKPWQQVATLLPWEELHLHFDLVIYGTSAPAPLLHPTQVPPGKRLIIDLGVPRNVDPGVARLPGIRLLNIDQLNHSIDRKKRRKASLLARLREPLIEKAAHRQLALFRKREHFLCQTG